jgi:16S rRNA (cytidine1402-2'-O)-methyltransferase
VPGACAAIAALTISGLPTERFQFVGFLPRRQQQLQQMVAELLRYPGVSICYEAPSRLVHLFEALAAVAPKRRVVIARELTKKFEELRRGVVCELLEYYQEQTPKGECVVLIGPPAEEANSEWQTMSLAEHVAAVEAEFGISRAEAIKEVAVLRNLPKREVYRAVHLKQTPS